MVYYLFIYSFIHYKIVCRSNDTFFSEAQTSSVVRSAHILLNVDVRNDDVVTDKKLITLPQMKIMTCPLALLREYKRVA